LRDPHEARLCQYNGSHAVFETCLTWIQDCISNHGLCCIPTRDQALPARLIRVGSDESDDPSRIVLTSELDTVSEYLTLSYCWGGASPLVLKSENSEALMKVIHINELPKTVADAITVTRGLKYQYLWVDSLCILQDSKDDWKDESAKMGQIYSNSVCTICASAAETADGGFLQTRYALANVPCCIDGSIEKGLWAVGNNKGWFDKYTYRSGPVCITDSVKFNLRNCKLNSRAWVVQVRRFCSPCIF
jgi:hypothetical protein